MTTTRTAQSRKVLDRGDVVLVRFPHPSGQRGKKRPAVVIQSDAYAGIVNTVVVAEVTKNLTMANDPACVFVAANTPEGKATGLLGDSVVSGLLLSTVNTDKVVRIGALSAALMQQLGGGVKAALALP